VGRRTRTHARTRAHTHNTTQHTHTVGSNEEHMKLFVPVLHTSRKGFLFSNLPFQTMLHATRCTYFNIAEDYPLQCGVEQSEIKYSFLSWPTAMCHSYTRIICIQLSIAKQSDYRRSHPLRKLSGVFEPVPLVECDYTHSARFRNTPCQRHVIRQRRETLYKGITKSLLILNLKLPFPVVSLLNRTKTVLLQDGVLEGICGRGRPSDEKI
jgi:hypothetical protein